MISIANINAFDKPYTFRIAPINFYIIDIDDKTKSITNYHALDK